MVLALPAILKIAKALSVDVRGSVDDCYRVQRLPERSAQNAPIGTIGHCTAPTRLSGVDQHAM